MQLLNRKIAVPSPIQYKWHEQERLMFVHFAPNTWQNQEYDDLSTPLSAINPQSVDTDQWCRAALSWGAKEILFVAKHVGGFCWWQTESSEYSVKNIPWKDGKGDLLADISASCKKYGINLGVYVYPGDAYYGAYVGSAGKTEDPAKQEEYTKVYRTQLKEVLNNYGDMIEVWFDGSNTLPISDIIEEHSDKCVVFQSPLATIRWVGNEAGVTPYPSWSTLDIRKLRTGLSTARHSDPNGDAWADVEVDTTLYNHNWFWSPENEAKRRSVEELMRIYYTSVGRGAVLILNANPNTDGLIPEGDMVRYEEFGRELDKRFGNPLGKCEIYDDHAVITFDKPTKVNHAVMCENYINGERIREYIIEAELNGLKTKLCEGSMVGSKRIEVFETVSADKLIFTVLEAALPPQIRDFKAFCLDDEKLLSDLISQLNAPIYVHDYIWQACGAFDGSNDFVTVDIDVSSKIIFAGEYKIEILCADGHDVSTRNAVAVLEGFETEGVCETIDEKTFVINRTAAIVDSSKTALRLEIKGDPCSFRIMPL